jgi:uncharacterized protein YjbI with pentapeptide repeats
MKERYCYHPSVRHLPRILLVGGLLYCDLNLSYAAQAPSESGSGNECRVEALPSWTIQEKWVWGQICVGKPANFNLEPGYGGTLDTKSSSGWPSNRVLHSEFLQTILLREPFKSAMLRQGVHIEGAWFIQDLDLSHATLNHPLRIEASRFEALVDFGYLINPHFVSFQRSKFQKFLQLTSIQLGSNFFIRGAEFASVNLHSAKILGQISMAGAACAGELSMENIEVGGSVSLIGATFAHVTFRGARIGDQLNLIDSTVSGSMNLLSAKIGGSVFMRGNARFGEVAIRRSYIGGNLELQNSRSAVHYIWTGLKLAATSL